MADVTTRHPNELTDEEHRLFIEACPHARRVGFSQELAPKGVVPGFAFILGVAVEFDDGRRHGMKMRSSAGAAEDRAHLLGMAAIKLRDWHDGKATP